MRLLVFGFTVALLAACSSPKPAADNTQTATEVTTTAPAATSAETYAGEWTVTVRDTPAGTVTGTMVLEEGAEGLTGKFVSNGRETALRTVTSTDTGLKVEFYSSEYQTDVNFDLRGEAGADELTGTALGSYGVVATRKM